MVVTDNASNITNAIVDFLQLKHYGCYAHKINLIVQKSVEPANQMIAKVKSIVAHFKRSNKAALKLVKYQEQSGIKEPKRLIQDIVTRWNSTFFMLERFVLLEEAIKHSLALLDTGLTPLTADEWEVCKQLCSILEPFHEVTKEMSTEKYLTASKVIPITKGLKSAITKLSRNVSKDLVKTISSNMLKGIDERFPNLEKSKSFSLCTFLDPKYKHYLFQEASTERETKDNVIKLVTGFINQKAKDSTIQETDEPNPLEAEGKTKVSVWDDCDETIRKVKPQGTAYSSAIREVQRYMDDPPISRKENSLEWWKKHQYDYPNLSAIVKLRCNLVATSVPSERVFSKTGYILTERRRRLTSQKVKELMFLNMNT
ncbi:zinc finger BED domain-containing protein 4-like [Macrosteles quadrilineatus]|uniref:zinc finger BED domain-containing protein 4-like n=1 Tax=Macrosteles quadrilineatus TaxID=74068 RepID=UPI0023E2CDD4|nr:zinc finger BED domain-containing protein 4-like [Macrosteles quadrilineatus]